MKSKNGVFFLKKLLILGMFSLIFSSQYGVTKENSVVIEEVIVKGIKQAQASAIDSKRMAASIVDSVRADDIGKLPDITISDSLQRITGVQIQRSAGEGGKINIRGLPQVLTTLNGEVFLGANSITTTQPDFNDIPSQLFSGADVQKSYQARQNAGGITGVIDLKTYLPFSFEEGVTYSGAIDFQTGEETAESDPSFNGLINWRNGNLGFMGAVSYQEKNLANYYSGMAGGGEHAGWSWLASEAGDWGEDINGDGDMNDRYIGYQGYSASNKFTERKRVGFNVAMQIDMGAGFELISQVFYTTMDSYDRSAGLVYSDKWNRRAWFSPLSSTQRTLADGTEINTVSSLRGNGRRVKSFSTNQFEKNESQNINIELNYDNGGQFTWAARAVHGRADKKRVFTNAELDLANGSQWGVEFQHYPSGRIATNANGYAGFPELTVDRNHWGGFDGNANQDVNGNAMTNESARSMRSYLSDPSAYGVGNIASENNFDRDAELAVFRFEGEWQFDGEGFIRSVQAGARHSSRKSGNNQYDYASPFGPGACLVKWKATDVTLDKQTCQYGANLNDSNPDNDIYFTAGIPMQANELGRIISVTDLGPVSGIPAFIALDPREMDDGKAFLDNFYPGNIKVRTPGASYRINLDELSTYFQVDIENGPFSANFGIRQIETSLEVTQNKVGDTRDYGVSPLDDGDLVTRREYTDTLPAFNMMYDITDSLKFRAAIAKTMTPLDLERWGGAFDPDYTFDGNAESDTFGKFIAVGATETGNPRLSPWRADNYSLSLEYYVGNASLISLGIFQIKVESFPVAATEQRALPDADGVVRRSVPVQTIKQGEGGTLEGVETAFKVAFSDIVNINWLNYIGADVNYTWSPGETNLRDVEGNMLGFPENSEHVFNTVLWYERGKWQARIGYNYRSERVVAVNQVAGLTLMQQETGYLDVAASYDINNTLTLFINGSNVGNESEEFYLQWPDQKTWENTFEPRYTIGLRGTF